MKIKDFFVKAREIISSKAELLNECNYFPVRDADTGSNILYTLDFVLNSVNFDVDAETLKKDIIGALKRGGRGNSGLILAAITAGFLESFLGAEVSAITLHNAFMNGKIKGYASVINPREGTMLSIIRRASEVSPQDKDVAQYVSEVQSVCLDELESTKNFITSFCGQNSVDSGALGIYFIIDMLCKVFGGSSIVVASNEEQKADGAQPLETVEICENYIYCLETILQDCAKSDTDILPYLKENGSSIACVELENGYKIHVHTNSPLRVLNYFNDLGVIEFVKIENMCIQELDKHKDDSVLMICSDSANKSFFVSKKVFFVTPDLPILQFVRDKIIIENGMSVESVNALKNNGCKVISARNDFESYIFYLESYRLKDIDSAYAKLIRLSKCVESFTAQTCEDICKNTSNKSGFLAVFTKNEDEVNKFIKNNGGANLEIKSFYAGSAKTMQCVLIL